MRKTLAIFLLMLAGIGNACAGWLWDNAEEAAEQKRQDIVSAQTHIESLRRVQNILYRLGVVGTPHCDADVRPLAGFGAFTAGEFPKTIKAGSIALGFNEFPRVAYVADGSPADKAGIRPGDQIATIGGKTFGKGDSGSDVNDTLHELAKTSMNISVSVIRDGSPVATSLTLENGCHYRVELVPVFLANAATDGNKIIVTQGLLDFVANDDELALVLGHEMSHAGLHHVRNKVASVLIGRLADQALKLTTGPAGKILINHIRPAEKIIGNANSQDYEREADYVGLYLLARAGYDTQNTKKFWVRLAAEYPEFIEYSYWNSHPATPERMLLLKESTAELAEKRTRGLPLTPDMKEAAQ
jgi:hypothetical protein